MNFLQEHDQTKPYLAISLGVAFLLHFSVEQWLKHQTAPIHPPKSVIIEVAMVTPPKPVIPPEPVIKEPPRKPKPLPPKKQAKPPPPKVKPIVLPKPVVPKAPPPKVLAQPAKPTELPKEAFTVPDAPINPSPVIAPSTAKPVVAAPSPNKAQSNAMTSDRNSSNSSSSGVVVLSRVSPKYPARALSRHIEGWVKIEFTVTPSGDVSDPSVVAAEPEDIFDDAALTAIQKWRFKEKIVNGKAVSQKAVQTLKFKLVNQGD
jgi:periplasmic protein TonB